MDFFQIQLGGVERDTLTVWHTDADKPRFLLEM